MKTFNSELIKVTFLCAVFCFAWSTQDKIRVSIKVPEVLQLRQEAVKCEQETGIAASNLRKIIDKSLPNDQAHNQFFYCVVSGQGYIVKDGHFVVDKMSTFQVEGGKAEDYVSTINECNKTVKDSAVETLVAVADCIHGKYQFVPAVQQ